MIYSDNFNSLSEYTNFEYDDNKTIYFFGELYNIHFDISNIAHILDMPMDTINANIAQISHEHVHIDVILTYTHGGDEHCITRDVIDEQALYMLLIKLNTEEAREIYNSVFSTIKFFRYNHHQILNTQKNNMKSQIEERDEEIEKLTKQAEKDSEEYIQMEDHNQELGEQIEKLEDIQYQIDIKIKWMEEKIKCIQQENKKLHDRLTDLKEFDELSDKQRKIISAYIAYEETMQDETGDWNETDYDDDDDDDDD